MLPGCSPGAGPSGLSGYSQGRRHSISTPRLLPCPLFQMWSQPLSSDAPSALTLPLLGQSEATGQCVSKGTSGQDQHKQAQLMLFLSSLENSRDSGCYCQVWSAFGQRPTGTSQWSMPHWLALETQPKNNGAIHSTWAWCSGLFVYVHGWMVYVSPHVYMWVGEKETGIA